MLNTDDDILICDPEGEYAPLVEAMGSDIGSVIRVCRRRQGQAQRDVYGGRLRREQPDRRKEPVYHVSHRADRRRWSRPPAEVHHRPLHGGGLPRGGNRTIPTLCTLRDKLHGAAGGKGKGDRAVTGALYHRPLDIFGHASTVDLDKRIVVFDIHGLGAQLKPSGLLLITDTMLNRVTLNWQRGQRTHVYRRISCGVLQRVLGAVFLTAPGVSSESATPIPPRSRRMEYLLDSVEASTMLSIPEFIVMLNQAVRPRQAGKAAEHPQTSR